MAENMMCSNHKTSNEAFRSGWDRIFAKRQDDTKEDTKKSKEKHD